MADGGYSARNGARFASDTQVNGDGSTLGTDFPMICNVCLGQNPYVRMVKSPFGEKLCKISKVPYQSFKWKAGPQGRYKETIISFAVARDRNICQACLNDMKYGLPVGLRDKLLAQANNTTIAIPTSDVGVNYYYQQQANNDTSLTTHPNMALEVHNMSASNKLAAFAKSLHNIDANSKTAFRNLPKLCSFWLNGSCTRVVRKTCPYRPCCGTFVFPEIAGYENKEIYAQLTAQLQKEGAAAVQKNIDPKAKEALRQALKGNKDDAIAKRVRGTDDLSQKYLNRMQSQTHVQAPSDQSVKTLWLGNIAPEIGQQDLLDVLYATGQIVNIHMSPASRCAFVEYQSRAVAEQAATQLGGNALLIKGQHVTVNWARPKLSSMLSSSSSATGCESLLPPPGLEQAPLHSYSLPEFLPPPPTGPPPILSQSNTTGHMRPREADTLGAEVANKKTHSSSQLYESMNPSRLGAHDTK